MSKSKEYGLNPSVTRCICCGKEYGIALLGTNCKDLKTKKTVQAPPYIYNGFCNECQSVVDQNGILVVEVYNGTDQKNPERTGRFVGCSNKVKQMLKTESPMAYMEQDAFQKMFGEYIKQ